MSAKPLDLSGVEYPTCKVLEFSHKNKRHQYVWKCECQCGNIFYATASNLNTGNTRSCGCLMEQWLKKRTHGMTHTRLFSIWQSMKARCFYSSNSNYYLYGGRGITICNDWLGENGFINFYNWANSHGYADNLTIDRIDVDGNYEPSNCRWVDIYTQSYNKRNTVYLTLNGETHNLKEWSEITGININVLRLRHSYYKWSDERTLTQEVRKSGNRTKRK